MTTRDPLPTESQREALAEMMALAFVEIRALARGGKLEQIEHLADAFHNLGREPAGWGVWCVETTRQVLQAYQHRWHRHDSTYRGMTDYLTLFGRAFPRGG